MIKTKASTEKQNKSSKAYAAFKAKNEIFYQMASIFKVMGHDDGKLAQKIFDKYLPGQAPEIFLEKSVEIEYKYNAT
jgi:hypothetical protein